MADTRTDEIAPPKEVVKAQKDVADLEAKRADIDRQIAEASVLIHAWENFNLTLRGEFRPRAAHAEPKTRKATGPRAQKGTLSPLQTKILAVVGRYVDGAKAETINQELDARGDAEKRRIAAALYKMNKGQVLTQAGARQPYTLGPNAPRTPATVDETAA